MANLTAVTGNWTGTAGTNTAFGGASVTTAADEITIPSGVIVTIPVNQTIACRSLTVASGGTLINIQSGVQLNIGDATAGTGSVALSVSSTSTFTTSGSNGNINFVSTSAAQQTINTGGKTLTNVLINGAGSSYILAAALTQTAGFTLSAGIFNTGNFNMTMASINYGNTTARTLTLGSSAITLTATANVLTGTAVTNLTVTANTAVITSTGNVTGNNNLLVLFGINWNGLSWVHNGGGQYSINASGGTLSSLTLNGVAAKTEAVRFTTNITITGTFAVNGNSAVNRVLVFAPNRGVASVLTVATLGTMSNVDFMDITAAGASAPWNLSLITGRSGDCGGNSGITFTTPATQTATGTGGFLWSTHGWTSRVPLPQDDVIIPNTFTAGQTITCDMPRLGKDITITATGNPTWNQNSSSDIYGSLRYASGMTTSNTNTLTFSGRGTHAITSNGMTYVNTPTFNGPGGTYTLQDALTTNNTITLTSGTLNTNSMTVRSFTFSSAGALTRSLVLGASTWNLTATAGTFWNVAATGFTVSAASSTIVIINASASTRTFATGTNTVGAYGTLRCTVAGSTGPLVLSSSSNTFYDIEFSDATNARTMTVAGTLAFTSLTPLANFRGTSGKLMTLASSVSGTARALAFAPGAMISTDYLSIQDMSVSTPLTFFAGANSTNVSGNTNIYFSAPGAYRYRQGIAGVAASATSITATYPIATTVGNLLIAYYNSLAGSVGVLTPPSGWTQATIATQSTVSYIYYKIADGTETTVAFSQTSARNLQLYIQEYTGFTGEATLDVTDGNSTASSVTTLSTNGSNPSNSAQPALALAALVNSATLGNTISVTNSFILDTSPRTIASSWIHVAKELTSLAAVNTTFTWTTSRANSAAVLVVFKDVPIITATGGFLPFF